MSVVNVHEAKTRLSELIARAEAGEEIVIARANKPAVKLVPVAARKERRLLGLSASPGFRMADDFDAPMADESVWYDGATFVPEEPRRLHEPAVRKPRGKGGRDADPR